MTGYHLGKEHGRDASDFELRRLRDENRSLKDWRNEAIRLSHEMQEMTVEPPRQPLPASSKLTH